MMKLGSKPFRPRAAPAEPAKSDKKPASKSAPNTPMSGTITDAELSKILDEQSKKVLEQEEKMRLLRDGAAPAGPTHAELNLPAFDPNAPRGGGGGMPGHLGSHSGAFDDGLDTRELLGLQSDPALLVRRVQELEMENEELWAQNDHLTQMVEYARMAAAERNGMTPQRGPGSDPFLAQQYHAARQQQGMGQAANYPYDMGMPGHASQAQQGQYSQADFARTPNGRMAPASAGLFGPAGYGGAHGGTPRRGAGNPYFDGGEDLYR